MEGRLHAGQSGARPRMSTEMQRVLVPLGLVLVFEPVRTVLALVLFFHGVQAIEHQRLARDAKRRGNERGREGWQKIRIRAEAPCDGGTDRAQLTLAPPCCRTSWVSWDSTRTRRRAAFW